MAKKSTNKQLMIPELVELKQPGKVPAKLPEPRPPAPQVGQLPELVKLAGRKAAKRFTTFFTDDIENDNTRAAYLHAVFRFFEWCGGKGLGFETIESFHVAAYREHLKKQKRYSNPTIKQHLAAIRKLYDWLVIGQVIQINPAAAVRGPKHVVSEGLTPILDEDEMLALLEAIDTSHVVGLRDRALISVMTAAFGRVEAVINMDVSDYFPDGKTWSIRLHEKNDKVLTMPVHHRLEHFLDAYIDAAGGADTWPPQPKEDPDEKSRKPLFRTSRGQSKTLTTNRMTRQDAFAMIRRRAKAAGIQKRIGNHTFRGTGITNFLENGGKLEDAQFMAAHSSARTTKLYDRRERNITRSEVERITILGTEEAKTKNSSLR